MTKTAEAAPETTDEVMPEPTTTPAVGTVDERWLAVMRDVQEIKKSQRTSGGSIYNFRGVDQVINVVGPVLRHHGVFVVPLDATVEYRPFTSGRNLTAMLEAFVTCRWQVRGLGGDSFIMGTVGQASDASDKAVAQASSVAYRIALLQGLCIPTDAPDPDEHHTDRATRDDEADEAAKALGWQDAGQRDAVWAAVLATAQALPKEAHDAIVLPWAKSVKLDPAMFTVAISEEWKAKIIEAAGWTPEGGSPKVSDGNPDTVTLPTAEAEAETPPPSSPAADPQETPDAGTTAATSAPSDGFDAEQAYGDLNEKMRMLDSKEAQKIEGWLEERKIISPAELTKALAAEWFAMLSDALGAAVTEEIPTARPWKSKAEMKRTFDSLLERQSRLPDSLADEVIDWGQANGVKQELDPQVALDWQARIIEAEFAAEAPFS